MGRVDEDKEKYKIGEIGDIGNVLKDLNTMYKKTAPGYVFINLGTIDIMKESPEKILFQIDEYVKDNNLRQTIYDKQKKYLNKIWSEKEKEAGNYYCSII